MEHPSSSTWESVTFIRDGVYKVPAGVTHVKVKVGSGVAEIKPVLFSNAITEAAKARVRADRDKLRAGVANLAGELRFHEADLNRIRDEIKDAEDVIRWYDALLGDS